MKLGLRGNSTLTSGLGKIFITGGSNIMSIKKDSHGAFAAGKASITPSKKKLKDLPYFTQTASGIGLVSGALLPSDPSITKLIQI